MPTIQQYACIGDLKLQAKGEIHFSVEYTLAVGQMVVIRVKWWMEFMYANSASGNN